MDQIRAVSKERLQQRLGIIPPERLDSIDESLKQILELG